MHRVVRSLLLVACWLFGVVCLVACTETVEAPVVDPVEISAVDLLFVWDRSSTMIDSLQDLQRHVGALVEAASAIGPQSPVHVGVISTDLSGGRCPQPGDMGQLLLRTDQTGSCPEDESRFEVFDVAGSSSQSRLELATRVGCRGIAHSDCGLEQPLESLLQAMTPASSGRRFSNWGRTAGTCEPGLFSGEALLAVYIASNRDDCSFHDEAALGSADDVACATGGSALHPISRYLDGIQAAHSPERLGFFIHGGFRRTCSIGPSRNSPRAHHRG